MGNHCVLSIYTLMECIKTECITGFQPWIVLSQAITTLNKFKKLSLGPIVWSFRRLLEAQRMVGVLESSQGISDLCV